MDASPKPASPLCTHDRIVGESVDAGRDEAPSTLELWCPFTTTRNAHAAATERRALDWARRFGLLEAGAVNKRLEYNRLAPLVHPHVPLPALQIATDWFSWLSLIDDEWDESSRGADPEGMRAVHERMLAVLAGEEPTPDDDPFTHALRDLQTRILACNGRACLARFTRTVRDYFAASRWEAENRQRGVVPTPESFLGMRGHCGATLTAFELFGVVEGIDVPGHVLDHPHVRTMSVLASNQVSWCNDLFSFRKERLHGDVHNLVHVLAVHHRSSIADAFRRAIAIHDADVAEFVALARTLPRFGAGLDEALGHYVAFLGRWMRGAYEFSLTAERFDPCSHLAAQRQQRPAPHGASTAV